MVILLKKDPSNPGVRGIASRFEALAAASPPPPPSPNNTNRPKISFREYSFSSSNNQPTLPVKVPNVSVPTKANGTKAQVPDKRPTPVEGATELVQTLNIITALVGEVALEEQTAQDDQSPSNTVVRVDEPKGEIAVKEEPVHKEPSSSTAAGDVDATGGGTAVEEATVQNEQSPSVAAQDVDVTDGEIAVEQVTVQEGPSQSVTAENVVEGVVATSQKEASVEQKSSASDTAREAQKSSENVLEE